MAHRPISFYSLPGGQQGKLKLIGGHRPQPSSFIGVWRVTRGPEPTARLGSQSK